MTPTEDEWRDRFRKIEPVPFSRALEERILSSAKSLPSDGSATVKRHRGVKRWFTASTGAAAAVVLAVGAWFYGGLSGVGTQSNTVSPAANIHRQAGNGGTTGGAYLVGLVDAPISVRLWTPSVDHATVYATLTNVGTDVIRAGTIFGVLSLSDAHTVKPDLGRSQWVSFVNAPRADIQPGDSVKWSFHPVGAPATSDGHLIGLPSLRFFQVGSASPAKADAQWQTVPVAVDQVSVQQRRQWLSGQSIGVTARITNTTSSSINLSQVLAVIWFAPDQGDDWTQPGVIRFLDRVTSDVAQQRTLGPGQSEQCLFRLIGARTTDFLGMVPRVSFVITR